MKNPTLFFVMGVSGCGKSTIGKLLAKALKIPFFDGDDYHPQSNIEKMKAGKALNDTDRQGWLESLNTLGITNKEKGAVIACSALKEIYRAILTADIESQTEFVYLSGSVKEISERLKTRQNHFMPEALLQSQFDTLEIPAEAITISITKTPAEILTAILDQFQNKKR